ncbi:MAG: PilZ domain-containing protein [Candidatus Omnitrophota bacterium]|nr:PilZ domain-containing protein [Candidatus Omnitrophota bacterium]
MVRKDKRKFQRLPVHHLLKYRVVGKENMQGVLSFVRNISAGGVLFHSQEAIPKDSVIELEVAINFPSSSEPLKVIAKILRSQPLRKIGGYDVAIEFINVDAATRDFINKKILNVYEKVKGGGTMKKISVACIVLAVIVFVLAVIARLKLGVDIHLRPIMLLSVANTCLLFSVALSLLKNR